MKKKEIVISLTVIILIILLFILLHFKNNQTITKDGTMFAMTLDGNSITNFPEKGKYNISIECENGRGIWLPEEWRLAIENIEGNVTCDLDFKSSPNTLLYEVENKTQINENGHRYNGGNPDNYIWFNNELWRIIGSILTCTSGGCATQENLVKIIRNEPIGGLAYDAKSSDYTGEWGSNTLYSILNTHYYTSNDTNLNGQESEGCFGYQNIAKAECDYSEMGILSSGYYGSMVKKVYWNTGASSDATNVASGLYAEEILNQTVSGYVGLITAGDYRYAWDASLNWLYTGGYEWTSTQYSTDPSNAIIIDVNGTLGEKTADIGYAIKPVVYLDPSVYVVSGDGTEGNPYQIAM